MNIHIDTGSERPQAKSEACEGLVIRFTNWDRADRNRRQVIEAIEACENPQEVDDYLLAESDLIDALLMFDWQMGQSIKDAAQEQRAIVGATSGAPFPRSFPPNFASKVKVDLQTGCWNWTGAQRGEGYGNFHDNGKTHNAHRFAYECVNGRISASGIVVCHSCDNRLCVNPAHLWLGTQRDNMRDKVAKGRGYNGDQAGEANPSAKLSRDDAIAIFNSPKGAAVLADAYSVHIKTIQKIKRGALWGDVTQNSEGHLRNRERPFTAQSLKSQSKGKAMFTIDTGDTGGSMGPWISWTSNGSAMKGFAPKSWVLRGKDDNDEKFETVVPAFANGCVMDLDSLQLGWEKDGAAGMAPERKWNPSISHATPRPDDSKKQSGAYAWSRALSVRCAIGDGKAATWEQGSFGAYSAFERLAKEIQAQYPGDGTLPLVKMTGVESKQLSSGGTNIPILTIVKWVPRPDCLKDDAPVIATSTPEPAPAQTAAQQAAAEMVDAEIGF